MYYSVRAHSTISVQYDKPSVVFIEPGINVFIVITNDIDAFVKTMEADGIRVDEVNKLDGASTFVEDEVI
jgi:hypothetical protein